MSVAPRQEKTNSGDIQVRRGITRRQALATALAAGVGVGAVRLLGGSMQNLATHKAGSGTDWVSPLGSESARVMHLVRRATFGSTPAQIESALADGFNRTVDRLIETKPVEPPQLAAASAPGGRFAVVQLQQWWIDHMLRTATPFAERMTLFWHGHFTSDYRKAGDNTFMYWQNLTWRRMSMTDLRSMLMQVTIDPAMLRYLDLATSTGQSPNENYSGVFNPRRAFKGDVSYLGSTGPLDTQGVIDRILAQPATAQFIAAKVAQHFVSVQPDAAFVTSLADAFRRSKYDMKTLMRAVFTSSHFTAPQSYRTLVKSPIEFMVHAVRALGVSNSKLIVAAGSGMGQSLFDPPDVGGWPNNESWISSNTVVERVNFVTSALSQVKTALPTMSDAARVHLDGVLSPQTASLLNQAADDRARWFITLASPEFQLK